MGLFDFFKEANDEFCQSVKMAWDELLADNAAITPRKKVNEISSSGNLPEAVGFFSDTMAGFIHNDPVCFPGKPVNLRKLASKVKSIFNGEEQCRKPIAGTPVYCKLALVVEHTGIYVGNGKIVHLNGDGNIEAVGPKEFCARLDGLNPTRTIYFAEWGGKALGNTAIANRAKGKLDSTRNYNMIFDNCHQFTAGCVSGDFDNACNAFWMMELEIMNKLGFFSWTEWDY